ncbi:MAG: transglutaminase-like domain-containing protein [Methanobacterium sp.]
MGIGGGIITKKLLFAVLLIASLSLGGLADANSAAAADTAKKSSNTNNSNEDINTQSESQNDLKTSTTTQKTVDKSVNSVQTTDSSKKTNTSTASVSTSTTSTSSPTGNTVTTQSTVTKLDPNGQYAAYGTKKYVKKYKKKYKKVTYKRYKKTYKKYYKYKTYRYVTYKKYKYHGKYYYKKVYKYKKVKAAYTKTVTKTYYKAPKSSGYSGNVNDSNISALSASLTKNAGSDHAKGTKIFNWVRDNINYSFYYNTKYGATGTLKYKKGNCVDHSHLIVALARSAGLQARYAHGKVRFSSGKTYGHVWAQIGINGKWYNADATSSRNSLGYMSGTILALKGIYNSLPF